MPTLTKTSFLQALPKIAAGSNTDLEKALRALGDGDFAVVTGTSTSSTLTSATAKTPAQVALMFKYYVTVDIADMSAEASYYVNVGDPGTITKIAAVVDGAIATADITVTAKIATVAVTTGVVTLATAASAAGTTSTCTPSALNVVTAFQAVELVVTGGGAGGTPKGHVTLEITRT